MIEYLVLAGCWLLLSLPVSVFLGKCIAVGQAGETERHSALSVPPETTGARPGEASTRPASGAQPALPTQRRPVIGRRAVAEPVHDRTA